MGVGGVELGVEGWLHFCLAVLFTLGGAALLRSPLVLAVLFLWAASALLRSPLALAVLFTPGGFGFASLAFGGAGGRVGRDSAVHSGNLWFPESRASPWQNTIWQIFLQAGNLSSCILALLIAFAYIITHEVWGDY